MLAQVGLKLASQVALEPMLTDSLDLTGFLGARVIPKIVASGSERVIGARFGPGSLARIPVENRHWASNPYRILELN